LPDSILSENVLISSSTPVTATGSLKGALAVPERQIILDALEANGWNRQNTAKTLGINRTTLYKKMKKYEIEFERQLVK
ncbi:MAG: helix-turn-helix domain-containing protein, partial [Planctomycetes bacterium]|nr:helix-turn-helix domain-containing protein [Planctomycetota bacterium]